MVFQRKQYQRIRVVYKTRFIGTPKSPIKERIQGFLWKGKRNIRHMEITFQGYIRIVRNFRKKMKKSVDKYKRIRYSNTTVCEIQMTQKKSEKKC